MDKKGDLEHREFLFDGTQDPRPEFIVSLLGVLEGDGNIVVYSQYEARIIRELARDFPIQERQLLELLPQVRDMLPLIRENVYDAEFHGSFSIKKVLPALVSDCSYEGLDIQDGIAASFAFSEMIDAGASSEKQEKIRSGLLAYCGRDTEAMVRVFQRISIWLKCEF